MIHWGRCTLPSGGLFSCQEHLFYLLPFPFYLSAGGCDGTRSMAKRSYPTSEIRGRSREDPMLEGQQTRGVTKRPRSGAAAKSARMQWRRNGREELPHVPGQEWWPGGATPRPRSGGCVGVRRPKRAIPRSRSGGAAVRKYPSSKVRSSVCALLEQP